MNLSLVKRFLVPHRILDIGANVGQFRTQASATWPGSYIFSIEASTACEPFLKKLTDDYIICMLAKDGLEYDFFQRKNDPTSTGNSMYRELTDFFTDDQLNIIKKDKNNSEILVVDTLKDLLQLLANHEIWVRFSDTSELRGMDIEWRLEEVNGEHME